MDAYSKAFRRDVLAACDSGIGTMAVAKEFGVSQAWVRKIKQDRREFGKLAPATTRQRVPKWAAEADRILAIQREKPDLTLRELKAELGTTLSVQTLCRALQKLKLTLKKKI
jgi:transposase